MCSHASHLEFRGGEDRTSPVRTRRADCQARRAGLDGNRDDQRSTEAIPTGFRPSVRGLILRREGPRRGLASLMQPLEAAPDVPFVMCRYTEARTRAAAIIAAGLPGGISPP